MDKIRASLIFFFVLIIFCLLLWILPSCNTQVLYHPGGPYYYGSFASYKMPPQPIKELSQKEAKLLESYYVAYFDDSGRIISFAKYLKDQKQFDSKYIYNSNGLFERRETTLPTGEVTISYFNEKGEVIKTEVKKLNTAITNSQNELKYKK